MIITVANSDSYSNEPSIPNRIPNLQRFFLTCANTVNNYRVDNNDKDHINSYTGKVEGGKQTHCHRLCLDYIMKNYKKPLYHVVLGEPTRGVIVHSIVIDKHSIVEDTELLTGCKLYSNENRWLYESDFYKEPLTVFAVLPTKDFLQYADLVYNKSTRMIASSYIKTMDIVSNQEVFIKK